MKYKSNVQIYNNHINENFNFFVLQLRYISAIYGTNPIRVTWKNAQNLMNALITKECLAKFSWTGKGRNNKKTKESLKNLNVVHQLIVTALKQIDSSYNNDIYEENMVKHIVKSAYKNEQI